MFGECDVHWLVKSRSLRQRVASPFAALILLTLLTATIAHSTEKKTLRIAFRAAETGFDPQRIEDRYSVGICENIFDSLLTYDWLARPMPLSGGHSTTLVRCWG